MIPQPVWQPSYERGLAHLRAGKADEALKAFDEAFEMTGEDLRPLRSRSEVLTTLREMQTACFGPEKTAELDREPVEVSERRLVDFFARLPTSLQTLLLNPSKHDPHIHPDTPRVTPNQFAESAFASIRQKRNVIDYLPPELMTIIGRTTVEDAESSDVAFKLCAVSRRWRIIFGEDPAMWGRVRLASTTQQKATSKTLAHLARGPITHLVLNSRELNYTGIDFGVSGLLDKLRGRVPDLRSLEVRCPTIPLQRVFDLVEWSWHLERLLLVIPEAGSFEAISFDRARFLPFESITTFEIRRPDLWMDPADEEYSLERVLEMLPRLQTLVVDHSGFVLQSSSPGQVLSLPVLERLVITDASPTEPNSTRFVLPKLQVLDLTGSYCESYIPYLFPSGHPPNTQHLTHLILRDAQIESGRSLVGHLPQLASLTHLDLCGFQHSDEILDALVEGSQHGPAATGRPLGLCPRLREVTLEITGARGQRSSLKRLVKSRWVGNTFPLVIISRLGTRIHFESKKLNPAAWEALHREASSGG